MKIHFFTILAVAFAAGNLLAAAAQPMTISRDADGAIHVGDSDFRIIHWSDSWSAAIQSSRSVILPGEGGETIAGKGIRRTGTFQVANGIFRYAETVHSPAPDRLEIEYQLDSDTPVPTATLGLCATFPVETLLKRTPKYNGRPFSIPEKFDEKHWQIWSDTKKLNTLELPLPSGILIIRGRFSAMWQDNRKYGENQAQLRLGFLPKMNGEIRHAEAAFSFEVVPYEVVPLNLSGAMNMGFKDECADDQRGGWTDQGPDNDLSMMKPGDQIMGGVTFRIVDPEKNQGKSCIVLRGPQREYFPAEARVAVDCRGRMLFLLNGLAWPPAVNQVCGEVEIVYADNSRQRVELRNGVDTGNFWFPSSMKNGVVVWENVNATSNIGLYATGIPLKDLPLKELCFRSRGAVWMIVAASVAKTEMKPELAGPIEIRADAAWGVIAQDNDVIPGSIVDFSNLLDAPAGKYGFCRVDGEHFEFEARPGIPVRFWGTNLTFLANFLSHAETDRMVDRIAAAGMNLVRLHHFDQEYVAGTYCKITDFAERRDRIDYLVAACRKRGIYLTLDLYTYRFVNGKAFGYPDRRFSPMEYKALVLFDPAVRNDFLTFTRSLMDPVNPYTGLAWKDDPAFAFIGLINETMLPDSVERTPLLQEVIDRQFAVYAEENDLAVTPENRNMLRERFVMEKTRTCVTELAEEIRKLGIRIPLTDINVGCDPRIGIMRNDLEFADNHMYWGHPTYLRKLWVPPVAITSASATGAFAGGLNVMFPARMFGMPYTITEWNFVDPNPYNVEGAFLTGAYGALQDYAGFCRFEWGITADRAKMGGFGFGNDPLQLMAMRAGSCFFLRGDVRSATTAIPMMVPEVLPANPEWRKFPEVMQRLGLLVKTGMLVQGSPIPAGTRAFVAPESLPDINGKPVFSGRYTSDILAEMVKKQILPARLIDLNTGRFSAETGEIELVSTRKSLKVTTDRSEAALGDAGTELDGNFARVKIRETFGAVLIAAHDGKPLAESRRIFICHLTDLKGEKMRFLDRGMSIVDDWGTDTMLMRRGSADITLKRGAGMKLYACSTTGKRLFPVAVSPGDDGEISLSIRNFIGDQAVCVYELIAEP